MQIFILGGTGTIGTGLVRELVKRGHDVTGLSRSSTSDQKLRREGVQPLRGDLSAPKDWAEHAVSFDALIHVADTFDDTMAEIDERLTTTLLTAAAQREQPLRLLYTGGCWLYGATGDQVATEENPFVPLSAFNWMIAGQRKLLSSPHLSCVILHPAMVYDEHGGVFENFINNAKQAGPFEVWGSDQTRWPLVERSDLARAYAELLDHPELSGHFNVTSQDGVKVGDIISAIAQRYGLPKKMKIRSVEDLVEEYGTWAEGPTIDQQMSSQKLQSLTQWRPRYTDFRTSPLFNRPITAT